MSNDNPPSVHEVWERFLVRLAKVGTNLLLLLVLVGIGLLASVVSNVLQVWAGDGLGLDIMVLFMVAIWGGVVGFFIWTIKDILADC